jgi:hypothetical protein
MIWVQNCNNHFEAKHGMTIDEACFKLIEKGNYQPVLKHILALGELFMVRIAGRLRGHQISHCLYKQIS